MQDTLSCFKAYDIRGQIPSQLNEEIAYRIGCAYAAFLNPTRVVVGRDVRLTSQSLCKALVKGLRDSGVHVQDIGLCATEEVYFATFHRHLDGGIMVTASHNPMDYNGMKLVREQAKPISADTGLMAIRAMMAGNDFKPAQDRGRYVLKEDKSDYIQHLLGYIDRPAFKPLKVVVNAGNGGAGPLLDLLEPHLPLELIKIHHEPDGRFPNGIPNPLLPECREPTRQAVLQHKADLGLAWDGDVDRCFFFDEKGDFIEGYYLVGLLAEILIARHPGQRIIHDPRLTWNTQAVVEKIGGIALQSKSGHAFMKQVMREQDAVYGGEMSAHHYFRTFSYCDSGMVPWLLVVEHLCRQNQTLSVLMQERMDAFPCSGEINFRVADSDASIQAVLDAYREENPELDTTDGVSAAFPDWRFNLRASNTEPLLRLNVETRGDKKLLAQRTKELRALIMADA